LSAQLANFGQGQQYAVSAVAACGDFAGERRALLEIKDNNALVDAHNASHEHLH